MDIKPYRDYDEHDVINGIFTFDGVAANKGSFVVAEGSGYNADDELDIDNLSWDPRALSAKFNLHAKVTLATSGQTPIGMLLKSHATYDENGERLLFHPRNKDERDVTITGQACPIVTKGLFLYSGIDGDPAVGSGAAVSDTVAGALKVVPAASATVGHFLGRKDKNGFALLKLNII